MTRIVIAALAACLLVAAPAQAGTPTGRLRAKIARLERSREHYKRLATHRLHELAIARQGAAGNLPAAVASVARQGRVSLLEQLIIGPLRQNWPCWTLVTDNPTREVELQLEVRPRELGAPPPPCYDDGFD
jgi:hypothetical protein